VHSGPDTGGSLLEREDRYYRTGRLNVRHCAILGSVDVVVAKDCQKEGRDHRIPNPLDSSEAAGIAARMERLDGLHRCLDVGCPQKAAVDYSRVGHKVVAGNLEVLHKVAVGLRGLRMAEIAAHRCLGVVYHRMVVVGRLKGYHNRVVSLEGLHKVVESYMTEIEAGSGSRTVVVVDCMTEVEIEANLRAGHIDLTVEGCIVYGLFRWVGMNLGELIQSIRPVGHYETNIHKRLLAVKC